MEETGAIEKAVAWAKQIASDNSHGYSQADRWGPDYDCSSLVISAWEQAGVTVKDRGATYTGNMRPAFLACGFVDVTTQVGLSSGYGLEAGDVLLNYAAHTCLYIGNGKVVNARTSEGNTQSGDQSGNEIRIQNYWDGSPNRWNCVLRYKEKGTEASAGNEAAGGSVSESRKETYTGAEFTISLKALQRGDKGVRVERLQQLLIARGYDCGGRKFLGRETADGDFGPSTERAVRDIQEAARIRKNGIAGRETMMALLTS